MISDNLSALIVAAGRGSRMMPLTSEIPKCMVEVMGVPIIENMIRSLNKNGIFKITIVIGYLSDVLINHLKDKFLDNKFTFIKNDYWDHSNSLYSLGLGLKKIIPPYIVIESDLHFNPELISLIKDNRDEIATLLEPYNKMLSGTFAQIDERNKLTCWLHESVRSSDFNLENSYKTVNVTSIPNIDLHNILCKTVYETLDTNGAKSPIEYAMQKLITDEVSILGIKTNGQPWAELDTPDEIVIYEKLNNYNTQV